MGLRSRAESFAGVWADVHDAAEAILDGGPLQFLQRSIQFLRTFEIRHFHPRAAGQEKAHGKSLWWPIVARNKKCITLDARTETGQQMSASAWQQLRQIYHQPNQDLAALIKRDLSVWDTPGPSGSTD